MAGYTNDRPRGRTRGARLRGLLFLIGAGAVAVQGLFVAESLEERWLRGQHFLYTGSRKPLAAVYSPNGALILTTEDYLPTSLRLYEAATGKPRAIIESDLSEESKADFTSDGRYIVYTTSSGAWRFDLQTQERVLLRAAKDDPYGREVAVFSRRGDVLAAFEKESQQLVLRSVKTQQVVLSISVPGYGYSPPIFSPNGRWLCWEEEGSLVLYDRETQRREPCSLPKVELDQAGSRRQLAFTLDSQSLILTSFCFPYEGGLAPGLVIYALDQHRIVTQEKLEALAFIRLPLSRQVFLVGGPFGNRIFQVGQGWREANQGSWDPIVWTPDPTGNTLLRPGRAGLVKIPRAQALAELGL